MKRTPIRRKKPLVRHEFSPPKPRKSVRRLSSKRARVQRMDDMHRKLILARDGHRCRKCGREGVTLFRCHVYSSRAHAIRWDDANVWAGCYACHRYWWHVEIPEAFRWIEQEIGAAEIKRLERARDPEIGKPARVDYDAIEASLRDRLAMLERGAA